MRDILFPFQETALAELHDKINKAHLMWSERDPQIISFSAPTGSGKTIIMTTLFEDILYGSADSIGEPDSVFIWLSDSPELNEQTRLKIESKSDKIRVRDLVTIESTFNTEYFEGGCIYFLNTQKLGSDKLLTGTSDTRQYSIWETLTNTAKRSPKQFYVVIDEAHRGTYTSVQAENKAQSIMQKFIKGSKEDGLCVMPLVIGVTATPQKFDNLIAGTTSTVQKVIVPPEQVRESGLLKDRIIIHYPDIQLTADMTMFKGAVDNWRKKCAHWKSYCEREDEKMVNPILVIQVEDGNEREATHTDLGTCIDLLEEGLHKEYWIRNSTRDHIDVKVEIIVLTNDTNAMERINDFAEEEFITLYENNKRAIAKLNEARKNVYERLINASAQPIAVPWVLPDSIDFYLPDDRIKFEQHLYCAEDGTFQTSLNKWESGVIDEELK